MTKKQGETNVWKQAQLDFSSLGYRLFRNQRYRGKICHGDKVTDAYANCGVGGDGGGDLVGYKIVRITQDMVGKLFARFTNLEAKTDKKGPSDEQEAFNNQIIKDGGIAGIIRPSTGTKINPK